MAVPTIAGGTQIEDEIRDELRDTDSTDYDFVDAELTRMVKLAIEQDYSGMRPFWQRTTINTVKDQDIYALPSNTMAVQRVRYLRNNITVVVEELTIKEYDLLALGRIRDILGQEAETRSTGFWIVVNNPLSAYSGKYIILYPIPDIADIELQVEYTLPHQISSNDYPTVPVEDKKWIISLTVARGLERLARMRRRGVVDYDVGTTRVRYGDHGKSLLLEARRIRQEAVANLMGSSHIRVS